MNDVYTYRIGDNLYLNLTNRCSNRCTFCVREEGETYEGYPLWLKEGEPSAETVMAQIGDPRRYAEIVFCGYGEPTFRLNELLRIADRVHAEGGRTRLNTNGQGDLINGREIAPLLKGRLDGVNISLNAPDAASYVALCRPAFGNAAFPALISFARSCKRNGLNAWFSVVDCIGREQIERCRALAEETGIPLRVRTMILPSGQAEKPKDI